MRNFRLSVHKSSPKTGHACARRQCAKANTLTDDDDDDAWKLLHSLCRSLCLLCAARDERRLIINSQSFADTRAFVRRTPLANAHTTHAHPQTFTHTPTCVGRHEPMKISDILKSHVVRAQQRLRHYCPRTRLRMGYAGYIIQVFRICCCSVCAYPVERPLFFPLNARADVQADATRNIFESRHVRTQTPSEARTTSASIIRARLSTRDGSMQITTSPPVVDIKFPVSVTGQELCGKEMLVINCL